MNVGQLLEIYAIYILDSTHIYVGGNFTSINNIPNTVRIAMWDSINNTWSALSTGISDGIVKAIYASDPNNIYVGGSFTSYFKRYNGSTWSSVLNSPDGQVLAIYGINSTRIYVGGMFTSINTVSNTSRIAMWNGSNWSALGSGIGANQVNAISVYNSTNVYVGGSFTNAGGVTTTSGVAMWDTTSSLWSSIGSSTLNGVTAIYAYDLTHIYVGCLLASNKYVAMWNGSTWISLGTGVYSKVNVVYAIDPYNVYFGGNWNAPTNGGISMWNGSSWQNVGEGPGTICNAMTVFNGSIYAGIYNDFKVYLL